MKTKKKKSKKKTKKVSKKSKQNKKSAVQVVLIPLARLKPYEKNARKHSLEQIQQIAESIKKFGFNNPILADDNMGVIAGHGRLEAAKLLKLKIVPVIALAHLTELEKRAYIIADNKLAENSQWDELALADELMELQLQNFDLGVLGFSEGELKDILADSTQEEEKIKEKEVDETVETEHKCPSCGYVW